ncbi:MAG: hypothetical protein AABY15_03055 [Nanoarchaeota archaeon]
MKAVIILSWILVVVFCWFFGVFTKVTVNGIDNPKYANKVKSAFFFFAVMLSFLVGMYIGLPFK